MAIVVAEEGKGPTVGMQLGRGHIDLIQKCTFEPREWKAKLEPLKGGCIHEEKGVFGVCVVINANGFTFPTRPNLHIHIVLPPKDAVLLFGLACFVRFHVLKRGYLIGFCHKAIGSPTIE